MRNSRIFFYLFLLLNKLKGAARYLETVKEPYISRGKRIGKLVGILKYSEHKQ